MSTSTSTPVTLEDPWILGDEDYADYACEDHAREWAEKRGIPRVHDTSYQRELEGHGVVESAYEVWPYAEADYPISCSVFECGQWLKTQLTEDGIQYMEEHDFPESVKLAYTS